MKQHRKIIAVVIVLLIITSIGGYLYYRRTPTYTLHLIQQSVQKHDWETFSKHVDTENVISTSYDAFMNFALEDETMDDSIKGFAGGFVKMMKPNIVAALNQDVEQWVKTGDLEDGDNVQQQGDSQQAADNLKKQSNMEQLSYKNIGDVTKSPDGTALVGVTFHDNALDKDFTLDLKMRQLSDGTWQVMAISNLQSYLEQEQKAREAKLAEVNQPVQDEINARVKMQTPTAAIVKKDAWGFSSVVQITVPTTIDSEDKPIDKIAGIIRLQAKDGKASRSSFEIAAPTGSGSQNLVLQKNLNPFLSFDKSLVANGLTDVTISVTVNKITYSDGTTLALKQSLDE